MDEDQIEAIKQQVASGEYAVDSGDVADALLQRLRELTSARRERVSDRERGLMARRSASHTECSYPVSGVCAAVSLNTTPAAPGLTRPIQVAVTVPEPPANSDSTVLRAVGGTHTQSS
jgi:hypothetical protein